MSDHERGAYTPPTHDAPLSFDARQPVRGARPAPFTLIISVLVLAGLAVAIFVFYRSGVRQAGQPPQALGAPVTGMKAAPPAEAQPQDPAAGLQVYHAESGKPPAAAAPPPAPQFAPPPEAPMPRNQGGPPMVILSPRGDQAVPIRPAPGPAPAPAAAAPPTAAAPPPPAATAPPTLRPAIGQSPTVALPPKPAPAPPKAEAKPEPKPAPPAAKPVVATPKAAAIPPKPAPEKAAPVKPAAAASGAAAVQIGAFSSQALADKGWSDAAAVAPGAAAGKGKAVEKIDKDGHTLFRTTVTGFANRADAVAFCGKLKAAGKACFVK